MTTNINKFDSESICATCLSQDRKLTTVSEVQACAKFCSELSLKWADRLCWECHHMVRKIIIFKNKAQKAQDWLRTATISQPSEIPCLSSLDTSAGIFLNVTEEHRRNPGLTSSDTAPLPQLNTSQVKNSLSQLNTFPPQVKTPPPQVKTSTAQVNPIPPPVFATVKQEVFDEDESMDIDDGRRVGSSWQGNVYEDRVKVKEEIIVEVPAAETSKLKRRKAPYLIAPVVGNIYTEEILSEEGMLEWWQKKKEIKYYTQSIPLERCDKCVQPLDCQTLLRIHADKHTEHYGDFECDVCTQRLIDERELEFHRKLHYRILKCNYCDFVWDNVNSMREHCSEMHNVKQTMWDCEQCMKQYPSSNKYTDHVRQHRRTKCPECGKPYAQTNLKHHMLQHQGGKPLHSCGKCWGKFRGEEGLKIHMRTHRTEVDPEAFCKECKIQFRDMTLYRCHLRNTNIHASVSDFRYKCKECGVKYLTASRLRNHMLLHSDTMFPCEKCDRSYNTPSGLQRHVQNKHEGRALPKDKLCDYCGKGFSDKSLLLSHINTHTGARPFVCKLCGADFGHKSALYLHGRYKHKIPKKRKEEKIKKKNTNEKDDSVNENSEKDRSEISSVDIVKDKSDMSSSK